MSPSSGGPKSERWWIQTVLAVFATLALASSLAAGTKNGPSEKQDGKKKVATVPGPVSVEIRFNEGSTMNVVLREERIELETRYGKLVIPVADIREIVFGLRISDEVSKQIETAIGDLGHEQFSRREAAGAKLLALREKAYPALLRATKAKDPEVVSRAEQLVERLRKVMAEDQLEVPPFDIVHTEDSRISGRVITAPLRITTQPFGDQQVKLENVRGIRSSAAVVAKPPQDALPDPGTLGAFQAQVGQTLSFKVTGPAPGAGMWGGVFGTGTYTLDSSLAMAAVHAGAIRPGQTGVVRVTILGPQVGFQGSMRNGVMSMPYGPWAGFRVEVPKKGRPEGNK